MRTTINIDEKQLEKAQTLTGIDQKPALIREALKALIARESARRLARLGGAFPNLKAPPRRRFGSVVADGEDSDEPFLSVNLRKEFNDMKNELKSVKDELAVVKTQRTSKKVL